MSTEYANVQTLDSLSKTIIGVRVVLGEINSENLSLDSKFGAYKTMSEMTELQVSRYALISEAVASRRSLFLATKSTL